MAQGYCRDTFFTLLTRRANRFGQLRVNESALAIEIGCHRVSVRRMIEDLMKDGRIVQSKRKGSRGVLLQLRRLPELKGLSCC